MIYPDDSISMMFNHFQCFSMYIPTLHGIGWDFIALNRVSSGMGTPWNTYTQCMFKVVLKPNTCRCSICNLCVCVCAAFAVWKTLGTPPAAGRIQVRPAALCGGDIEARRIQSDGCGGRFCAGETPKVWWMKWIWKPPNAIFLWNMVDFTIFSPFKSMKWIHVSAERLKDWKTNQIQTRFLGLFKGSDTFLGLFICFNHR